MIFRGIRPRDLTLARPYSLPKPTSKQALYCQREQTISLAKPWSLMTVGVKKANTRPYSLRLPQSWLGVSNPSKVIKMPRGIKALTEKITS